MKVECRNKRILLRLTSFGTVARVAGLAVRDGFARSLLLTGNAGTAPGVHAGRAQTCSAFIPNVDEITICLRERTAELSDACRSASEAGMNQLPAVNDGAGIRNRGARQGSEKCRFSSCW
jgi:hypothetical protein